MAKNDNANSIRMIESLSKNVETNAADEFEKNYVLSKSASIDKKYEWAKNTYQNIKFYFAIHNVIVPA
ncbi:MAG: hypothetical protein ACLRZ9_12620 [Eubacterium sp.]